MGLKVNTRGYFDWLVQRITAVLMTIYGIYLFIFLIAHHPLTYANWHHLFDLFWVKMATLVVVFGMLWHVWIGLWTVFTDYVKCAYFRLLLEVVVLLVLAAYFMWCVHALWS